MAVGVDAVVARGGDLDQKGLADPGDRASAHFCVNLVIYDTCALDHFVLYRSPSGFIRGGTRRPNDGGHPAYLFGRSHLSFRRVGGPSLHDQSAAPSGRRDRHRHDGDPGRRRRADRNRQVGRLEGRVPREGTGLAQRSPAQGRLSPRPDDVEAGRLPSLFRQLAGVFARRPSRRLGSSNRSWRSTARRRGGVTTARTAWARCTR